MYSEILYESKEYLLSEFLDELKSSLLSDDVKIDGSIGIEIYNSMKEKNVRNR